MSQPKNAPEGKVENLAVQPLEGETHGQTMARGHTMPENLSAAVLVGARLAAAPVTDLARELRRQTEAINRGDMTRAENMLLAQAHTLDALFANLATRAMNSRHLDNMEVFMRLAFKAQSQSRATLQTLGDLKAPKNVSFVKQANIGKNVQVNNGTGEAPRTRTRKTQKPQNELLEADHVQRMDARAPGQTIGADPQLATVGKKHRAAE